MEDGLIFVQILSLSNHLKICFAQALNNDQIIWLQLLSLHGHFVLEVLLLVHVLSSDTFHSFSESVIVQV